jgi:opacity protein-like surface antigen
MKKIALPIALIALSFAPAALAQDAPSTTEPASSGKDRGAIVAGGKFGGVATFSGFGPNITGAVEVGYIAPILKRGLGLLVDVSYAAPVASGTEQDPRVPSGSYEWKLYQKQLAILPMLTYRYTALGKIVPYIGAGPRIVMLESVTEGTAGGVRILENKEQSTKVGVGAPLGAEYLLGPGAALAELMFQFNPIDHQATGSSNLMSLTLWIGYRAML